MKTYRAPATIGAMILLDERQVEMVFERLASFNPEPETELESANDYTLLVAVMLSAQMTDRGVNRATGALFALVNTPEKMLALGEDGLKSYIKSINLYPTKARHIIGMSQMLVDTFNSSIPSTREELESLPGVGRKTANVILNVVFGESVMPVDTHLLRLAPRLGLSAGTKPREVEDDLLRVIPSRFMKHAHHWLLLHGRYVCTARNPHCADCCLADFCPKNGIEKS